VDSHPQPLHWSDGTLMRPRIQSYDSPFTLERTDSITLHKNSVPTTIPSQPGVPVFDDLNTYWYADDAHNHAAFDRWQLGWNSVIVPKSGTQVRVKSLTPGGFMQVEVRPSK